MLVLRTGGGAGRLIVGEQKQPFTTVIQPAGRVDPAE
jgi:hypothetical protein